jgi:hypothetical protein
LKQHVEQAHENFYIKKVIKYFYEDDYMRMTEIEFMKIHLLKNDSISVDVHMLVLQEAHIFALGYELNGRLIKYILAREWAHR